MGGFRRPAEENERIFLPHGRAVPGIPDRPARHTLSSEGFSREFPEDNPGNAGDALDTATGRGEAWPRREMIR